MTVTSFDDARQGDDFLLPTGKFGKIGFCRTAECKQKVVFVRLTSGKTPPFNADGLSHFSTCVGATAWKGKARTVADGTQAQAGRDVEADGTRGMRRG